MKFTVLGSGSSGNAILISNDKTNVLIDAGLSATQVLKRLSLVGVDYEKIDAVLITHEHTDHAGGLRVLLQTLRCPVFISELTLEAYFNIQNSKESERRRETLKNRVIKIETGSHFCIGQIDFYPFSIPHDAVDNFGFVAESKGVRIASLMDFGYITNSIKQNLKGCDGIIIESNHSLDMLKACSLYSWTLKQRIMSKTGHLSNEDLCKWLKEDFDGNASHIVLAHLSQRANEPNLALLMAQEALLSKNHLSRIDTKIIVSHPHQPTEWIQF
ncbi:MAG: MBL fold metallo-hydrolase [Acidobacteria bacterium]|jgi:phosphoribosyl 1,2-cyclic phosphodiesterase|nr:MAG: MBL fold metallo-hydrolase [Acidobacteriota bacterium]GIU81229.1 MAG: MBL fold metallo-hydrolase [Pyrinomonadaceae bacterium]